MPITFDPAKNRRNIALRGLSFDLAGEMDWTTVLIRVDARKRYPEPRYLATGLIQGEVHAVVFAFEDSRLRVISLRKANRKETRLWRASRAPA